MSHLAERRGFYMVRLEGPPERQFRGNYQEIGDEWNADLILEHEFGDELTR